MRYSPSRISRLFNRVRPARWFQKLLPLPTPPAPPLHPSAEALGQVIAATIEAARQARVAHGEIGARIQEVIDVGEAYLPLLQFLPGDLIETLASEYVTQQSQITVLRDSLGDMTADSDALAGTTSLAVVSGSAPIVDLTVQFGANELFRTAFENYIEVVSRPSLDDEVRALLLSFGLDLRPPGDRSCVELFDVARQAYGAPIGGENPSMTSLLPIRECIRQTINGLMQRRPAQEAAGSELAKIRSIGRQLKRQGVSDDFIDDLAEKWHKLNDDLSGSKNAAVTRGEWRALHVAATRYLHSFLTALDPSALRPVDAETRK